MDKDSAKHFRFRSYGGVIYSADPSAFEPRLTVSRARALLNDLYDIAVKNDPELTNKVMDKHNA